MTPIGQLERATQNRVVMLLENQLGWEYLGNWHDRENNSNIEESYLRSYLQTRYNERLIDKAIRELSTVAGDQTRSLYEVNKDVYELLRYGVKVREEIGENKQTVWLIDWQHPENNRFGFAEEVSVRGENKKRPDIVLYVNGIALGVLELKRSTVSVSEGIRQNLDNQKSAFIKQFFHTMQLVMAGNDTEGLRYGAIETSEKYYLKWKEADRSEHGLLLDWDLVRQYETLDLPLDKHLVQICNKKRFLEIIYDFTLFDGGTKKLCRPHQYFGVKAAQQRIQQQQGGIIWHSQGSGKSLTMVWLAKWIREQVDNSRVLIITDRDELDKQIVRVFDDAGEQNDQGAQRRRFGEQTEHQRTSAALFSNPQIRTPGRRRIRGFYRRDQKKSASGICSQREAFRFRRRMPPHPIRQTARRHESHSSRCAVYRVYRYAAAEDGQKEKCGSVRHVHSYLQV